jgi:hypothetical protein
MKMPPAMNEARDGGIIAEIEGRKDMMPVILLS